MVLVIKEIMDPNFLKADPSLSAFEGARQMVAARHGYLLLLEQGTPSGIVTEWDFIEKVVAQGIDPRNLPLREIASTPVISTDQRTPTEEVVDLMVRKAIRRMVVTDQGRAIGMVEAKDVVRSFRAYVDRVSAEIARLQSTGP